MCCKNYNDALFYFIHSAKMKSVVTDGLIKKKSLKRIFKLLLKMAKKFKKYGIINQSIKEKLFNQHDIKRASIKRKITKKNLNHYNINNKFVKNDDNYNNTFNEEIQKIKTDIIKDINECNIKEVKDIIIIIDFNIYTKLENNEINEDKIENFITQAKLILNNYLSPNDRFATFIYNNQYQILCPLMYKYQIDLKSFSNDLNILKEKVFQKQKDFDINLDDFDNSKNIDTDLKFDENNFRLNFREESSEYSNNEEESGKNFDKMEGLIETINYIKNYIKIKEEIKNEKYIILFTDLFNANISDNGIENIFVKLKENKETKFILVGKNKSFKQENNKSIFTNEINEEQNIINIFLNKFHEKSEMIPFENISKIKNIISNNNAIKDEIIFPNEIYK